MKRDIISLKPDNLRKIGSLFNFGLILLSLFLISAEDSWANGKSIDHIIVYVDSPTAIVEKNTDTFRFAFFSAHKVFVGNHKKIEKFNALLNEVLKYSDSSVGEDTSEENIFLSIEFFDTARNKERLFVSRNRQFSFEQNYGKIPKDVFENLVNECEQLVNIIDLNYQESVLYNSKVKNLCVPNDLSNCQ